MTVPRPFPCAALDGCGLNRQAVLDLDKLPDDMLWKDGALAAGYRQLILIGHGGTSLWEAVTRSGINSLDPIDDFTLQTIQRWMTEELPGNRHEIVYPGPQSIPLQRLGALAGWHHATPLMLGIDADWGTWFAYRAAVLADTHFAPTLAVDRTNPCTPCATRPCVAACPASAMSEAGFALQKCLAWRQLTDSTCAFTCLARLACPVGNEHRYGADQLRHAYSVSLRQIREHV